MPMSEATWDDLDPEENYYGWHRPRIGTSGAVTNVGDRSLAVARSQSYKQEGGFVVALLDGEVVRVPDGDPPKKMSIAELVELQRVSDEAELAWLMQHPQADLNNESRQYVDARTALLRALLAKRS